MRDFGVGIDKKHQKKIFQRFYRRANQEVRYEGTGLGLYISREIVKRHRGKIWVESIRGKGSTFYFTLPRRPASNTI